MNTSEILSALDDEISRLRRVRDLLSEAQEAPRGRGRPKGSGRVERVEAQGGAPKKRSMSPEARERIAAAQRLRWSKRDAPAKKAAKGGSTDTAKATKAAEDRPKRGRPAGKATAAGKRPVGRPRGAKNAVPAKKRGRPAKTAAKGTRLAGRRASTKAAGSAVEAAGEGAAAE